MANKIRIEEEDLKSIKEALWEDFEIGDVFCLVGDIYVTVYFINPVVEGTFWVTLQKQEQKTNDESPDDTGSKWVVVDAYAENLN